MPEASQDIADSSAWVLSAGNAPLYAGELSLDEVMLLMLKVYLSR